MVVLNDKKIAGSSKKYCKTSKGVRRHMALVGIVHLSQLGLANIAKIKSYLDKLCICCEMLL